MERNKDVETSVRMIRWKLRGKKSNNSSFALDKHQTSSANFKITTQKCNTAREAV